MNLNEMFKRLWHDDVGSVIALEYLLLCSIIVVGLVAGLSKFRDVMNSELETMAGSIGQIREAYMPADVKRMLQKKSNPQQRVTEIRYFDQYGREVLRPQVVSDDLLNYTP